MVHNICSWFEWKKVEASTYYRDTLAVYKDFKQKVENSIFKAMRCWYSVFKWSGEAVNADEKKC